MYGGPDKLSGFGAYKQHIDKIIDDINLNINLFNEKNKLL